MEGEFNDLATDNLATSFDNSPNNLSTSDELSASEVYDDSKKSSYSLAKKVAAVATVAVSLVTASTVLSNLTSQKPYIEVISIAVNESTSSLDYEFKTHSVNNYFAFFTVKMEGIENPLLEFDITSLQTYSGSVTLPQKGNGTWQFSYASTIEGTKTKLRSETFTLK